MSPITTLYSYSSSELPLSNSPQELRRRFFDRLGFVTRVQRDHLICKETCKRALYTWKETYTKEAQRGKKDLFQFGGDFLELARRRLFNWLELVTRFFQLLLFIRHSLLRDFSHCVCVRVRERERERDENWKQNDTSNHKPLASHEFSSSVRDAIYHIE